ncbi:bifunctional folylpolyglutamate synthase/dihydrofolate synthase [Evansella tamaricis]|uniref:tetrahydrofolate synthase n=1 Tax=Evansella tamaricis TaxID=2069301 RepID=A0ABS6JBF5_9BACI|nr:folylpolyglutamate synthase/dihydrofolate synthase family protein [Evansella tamaricis]MBU9711006.1 bifunctional folylpolyglutamate synthase/dihydrofolate synthase [Evansella tamaricis]
MIHTYEDALQYVDSKKVAGIRYDLKRIEALMENLRHPERKVKTIHVAGTNGKGSTVTYLRSMLSEANFFVGTFMTPVFGEVREQISINGIPMSEEDFTLVITEIQPVIKETELELGETISEFELMTTLAFYYFSFKKPVDIAVIEAGMGGKNDATNVAVPLVSIITNVAMDHEQFLGNSIAEISEEKAGIIKPGIPVFTGATGVSLQIIQQVANQKKSKAYNIREHCTYSTEYKDGKQKLTYQAPYRNLEGIHLGMAGEHQGENAALAILAVDYLKQYYALMVDDDQIEKGMEKAKLPGRFEIINGPPPIILDTAHNPDAVIRMLSTLTRVFPKKKVHVLFASMRDKEVEKMLTLLHESSNVSKILVTSFLSPRAMDVGEYETFNTMVEIGRKIDNPSKWINDWKRTNTDTDDILLITGSHQFIGEMRKQC